MLLVICLQTVNKTGFWLLILVKDILNLEMGAAKSRINNPFTQPNSKFKIHN
jgi:hypothetical protein